MWEFPWTDSQSLVDQRMLEELLKRAWGDPVIKFPIPINWIDEFDTFSNFRYQDPFGLSATGSGEAGRYYYIVSETYNWQEQQIDIVAIDLQFLLRQYCILGDEGVQASNWAIAGEADRMFCYCCDEVTGLFDDGEPGKILVDENILP